MIPRRLVFDPFMTYERLDRTFPPRGVVLVVGPNGTGKSTLVEGIAWALHGETIRGASPGAGKVALTFDKRGETYTVERTRDKKGKVDALLRAGWLEVAGGAGASGITVTETQAKINALVGDWRRFSCTQVFSKELMQRFGLATDKERKALLEGMLGLGQFDRALKVVREKLADTRRHRGEAAAARAGAEGRVRGLEERALPPAGDQAALQRDVERLHAEVVARGEAERKASAAMAAALEETTAAQVAFGTAGRARQETFDKEKLLTERLSARGGLTSCPVCLRDLGDADRGKVQEHLGREVEAAHDAAEAAGAALALAAGDLMDAKAALEAARKEADATAAAADEATDTWTAAKRLLEDEQRAALERAAHGAKVAAAKTEVVEMAAVEAATAREEVVLGAADEVLGLQGARNMLLGRALSRLERAANFVLGRVGHGLKVKVGGTTALKSGKEVDKVSVEVEAPKWSGEYRGVSGGEKARFDVSLLLGLASLAPQDRGGAIFFDEVFDSLDKEGVERVATFLSDMGSARLVVVITHNEDLVACFPRSSVWRCPRTGELEAQA